MDIMYFCLIIIKNTQILLKKCPSPYFVKDFYFLNEFLFILFLVKTSR